MRLAARDVRSAQALIHVLLRKRLHGCPRRSSRCATQLRMSGRRAALDQPNQRIVDDLGRFELHEWPATGTITSSEFGSDRGHFRGMDQV